MLLLLFSSMLFLMRATWITIWSLLFFLNFLAADSSDQSKDQHLLSHLLRSVATLAGSFDAKFCSELLQALHDSQKLGTSAGTSSPNGLISDGVPEQASTGELPSTPEVTCPTSFRDPSLQPVNHSVCVAATTEDISSKKHLTEACLGKKVLLVSSLYSCVGKWVLFLAKRGFSYLLPSHYLQILQQRGLSWENLIWTMPTLTQRTSLKTKTHLAWRVWELVPPLHVCCRILTSQVHHRRVLIQNQHMHIQDPVLMVVLRYILTCICIFPPWYFVLRMMHFIFLAF